MNMLLNLESQVTTAHRAKLAYIYVRQSTAGQVRQHEARHVDADQRDKDRQGSCRVLPPAAGGIQAVIPPSCGDLWRHSSTAAPKPPPKSRPRLPGASQQIASVSSPRPPAALNPHRPRPSIRGFVQSGFCARRIWQTERSA
jgi:hypothetical protein